jgi:hypothetical protein
MHYSIMKLLESPIGQSAEDFADAMHRNLFPDGRNMLETIHAERMMKRVNTDQILITPNATSNVKLSELNRLLNEMKLGEGAVKRLEEIDSNAGLVDAKTKRAAEQQYKNRQSDLMKSQTPTPMAASPGNSALALSDQDIATNLLVQAERMIVEGNSLIKEAARMKKEAEQLFPKVATGPEKEQTVAVPVEVAPVPKRGRPSKSKTVNAA